MKKINNILIKSFHCINLILIVLYLYPGSIFGYVLYKNFSIQPQITRDFLISSNHFYVFIILSIVGILAFINTKKINFLIKYLFVISILLEFLHMFIPNRSFELSDLFGNIVGVIVVVVVYKIKQKI
jgi:VanZ family protein|tara:strand:- start:113 stop:493 length:381 start_codon:yes stop_codon:yes gene_type:complete